MSTITAAELRPGEVVIGSIRDHEAGTICPACGEYVTWLEHEPVIATGEVICAVNLDSGTPPEILNERDVAVLQLARAVLDRAERNATRQPNNTDAFLALYLGRIAEATSSAADAVFNALNMAAHSAGEPAPAARAELEARWTTGDGEPTMLPPFRPFADLVSGPARLHLAPDAA